MDLSLLYEIFYLPFQEYAFLRRALVGCLALSLGCGPIGVFLVLRRMSLMGDALSHSLLPGVAMGFFMCGFSSLAMGLGGLISGLCVALFAGMTARHSVLYEDASFAGFHLTSMALGIFLMSLKGSQVDLVCVLFGTVLSLSLSALIGIALISTITLIVLALIYRALLMECFDPLFFRSVGGRGTQIHMIFLFLVTLNLVAAFQSLGTLMALGMMLLPAIAARLWAKRVWTLCTTAVVLSCIASYLGLLLSFHFSFPSGPTIILIAGLFYIGLLLLSSCRRYIAITSLLFLMCNTTGPRAAPHRPLVIASFSILGDLIQNIGQDQIDLRILVGPNADAHVYEPTPRDLCLLRKAHLVMINGLGFERWMERLIQASGSKGTVVNCSNTITPRWVSVGSQHIPDPHAWHSIQHVRIYVQNIAQSLAQHIPQHANVFLQRARLFDQTLEKLNMWVHAQLDTIPPEKRILLTAHDAFGYLGQSYGLTLIAPMGVSTESEPSAKTIAQLIQKGRSKQVRTAFIENITNPALVEQIANQSGMTLGGTLYSDALSNPHEPASTYTDMMRHNICTIVRGLIGANRG